MNSVISQKGRACFLGVQKRAFRILGANVLDFSCECACLFLARNILPRFHVCQQERSLRFGAVWCGRLRNGYPGALLRAAGHE